LDPLFAIDERKQKKHSFFISFQTLLNPHSKKIVNTKTYKVGKMRKLPHHVMFQIDRQKPKPSEWDFSVL